MRKRRLIISIGVLPLLYFSSCNFSASSNINNISTDSVTIARGEASFIQHCSSCHNFKQGSIGPQLGGLTNSVSAEWIQQFIRDPQKIIESGDKRAQRLFKKYKVAMPSFSTFNDDEINDILAFLDTHKKPAQQKAKGDEIVNPIPEPIALSNLVVGLQLFTQIPPSSDSGKMPLTRITKLDFEPHTGSSFILDLRGKLYRLKNNKAEVYMDIAKLKPKFIDEAGYGTGFGSFAFHPDFVKNGLLYTTHSESPGSVKADFSYDDSIKVTLQYVLTEWKAENPSAPTFSGTGRELLRVNMPYVIHGIQEIAFNPLAKPGNKDYGKLFVGVGDGGCVEIGYPFLTHNLEKIWGTILRIDPSGSNSTNGKYGIPIDNPFAKSQNTKTLREIYAWGFKNPHRITWSKSGQIMVCNIGEANIESINLVMPGHDYGWPIREGNFVLDPYGDITKVYPLPANDSIYHITYPIAQYDHDGGWIAISGGYEYTGSAIPQLSGKFIFGDIASGRLFYIEMADVKQGKLAPIKEFKFSINGRRTTTFKEIAGNDNRVDMHFGRDARGELYILIKPDGKVYKLVSASMNQPN
jgi:glucose/arabinose dehydrogenase/mono/diheme cytochrome c family protein